MSQSASQKAAKLAMEAPLYWKEMIDNIRKVRKKFPAPVDSMGCDQCHNSQDKTQDQRVQILISLMLSSQTKDPITWAAVQKLKENGCGNVTGLLKAKEKDIEDMIYPVGFYRRKAIYLKKVAAILHSCYNDDIPKSIKELCALPGVGPKMAHLCMQEAWSENTGIGVDVHVHRISDRLGWVPKGVIKSPEDTRIALESWMPAEYWREINHLLVGFGQTICSPLRPKCDECYNSQLCPSAFREQPKSPKRKSRAPIAIKVADEPSEVKPQVVPSTDRESSLGTSVENLINEHVDYEPKPKRVTRGRSTVERQQSPAKKQEVVKTNAASKQSQVTVKAEPVDLSELPGGMPPSAITTKISRAEPKKEKVATKRRATRSAAKCT